MTFSPVIISRKTKTEFKVGRATTGTQRFREGRKKRLRKREMGGGKKVKKYFLQLKICNNK